MSENELSRGESSSEGCEDVYSSDGEDYYVFNGDFAPVVSRPLSPCPGPMRLYSSILIVMQDAAKTCSELA